MQFWLYSAASALSALWLIVHLTAGEKDIARPFLQATDLDPVVRETQYLCWHFTSVGIACMAMFFALSTLKAYATLAIAGTILAGSFAAIGIGLVITRKGSHKLTPQGWLFLPVLALGLSGLFS